jgi:hypothetical protein
MMKVQVTLDFACYHCSHPVSVTVECEGKGLAAGPATVAAVVIPCPTCGAVNKLFFEPSGKVRAVKPCPTSRLLLEPSLN